MKFDLKIKVGTITDACGSLSHNVVAEITSRPFKDPWGHGLIYSAATLRVEADSDGRQPMWLPEVDYKSALGKVYTRPRTVLEEAQARAEVLAKFQTAVIDASIHYQKKFPNYFNPEV